jgi:hypothetical protein
MRDALWDSLLDSSGSVSCGSRPKWRMKATLVVGKIEVAHCESILAYLTSRHEEEVILDLLVELSTP